MDLALPNEPGPLQWQSQWVLFVFFSLSLPPQGFHTDPCILASFFEKWVKHIAAVKLQPTGKSEDMCVDALGGDIMKNFIRSLK